MTVLTYPHDPEATAEFSALCDVRIVWGGDATIEAVRRAPLPATACELVFPDRYSICVLDATRIHALADGELDRLAHAFYNDTYAMDQNACSSPATVVWIGDACNEGKERFWRAAEAVAARRYSLEPVPAVEKYTQLLSDIIELDEIVRTARPSSYLYRIQLGCAPRWLERLRGRFGSFFELEVKTLDELVPAITPRLQTLTYFGVERAELRAFVVDHRLSGVHRIVPVGRALDMSVVWDGVDVIAALSRIVDVAR